MTPEIIRRIAVAQSTIDHFLSKPFEWNTFDCVHLVDYALTKAGFESALANIEQYTDYKSARKAMKAAGISKFEDYLDTKFERIAPVSALPGDVVAYQGISENNDKAWLALGVHIGNGRAISFAAGQCDYGPDILAEIAWRVPFGGGSK